MGDLRSLMEAEGFTDVATYIQTGNVVFTAKQADPKRLARSLEKKLETAFGFPISVFVLTPAQLKRAAANNPFDPKRRDAEQRCHLLFLGGAPSAARRKALMELEGDEYRFHVKGAVLYYAYSRENEGRGRRSIDFEKVLGVTGTGRSWKVVDKLIELTNG
jgi:uncharacterized protein (DUF1697 family)